jgi:hypothetical protein
VGAELIQFLPLKLIVQVAQGLDTILITRGHSASFPPSWRWRSVKAVATDKNTLGRKIFPQLCEAHPNFFLLGSLFNRRPKM